MNRSPLTSIERFLVPESFLTGTLRLLQEAGSDGYEAFVLWGGLPTGDAFEVKSALIPEQVGSKEEGGLLVTISGRSLFEVNRYFFSRGHILGVQIHSHPTDAFHSATDNAFPMATLEGALSIVVPYFGQTGVEGRDSWAYFRLKKAGWVEEPRGSRVLAILE